MHTLTLDEFVETLHQLFTIEDTLTVDTDLSLYIRDSIDLGELVAVLKEEYGVVPRDLELFKTTTRLGDVIEIFNHDVS